MASAYLSTSELLLSLEGDGLMVESMLTTSSASGKVFDLFCFGGSKEVTLSPMGLRRLAARRSTMKAVVCCVCCCLIDVYSCLAFDVLLIEQSINAAIFMKQNRVGSWKSALILPHDSRQERDLSTAIFMKQNCVGSWKSALILPHDKKGIYGAGPL